MQKILTAEEMREVDRLTTEKYGIPSILLMENAAHAAANVIKEKLGGSVAGKSFLILCGKGNNGGDGAALARILWMQGANVEIYLFGKVEETKGDARINFEAIKKLSTSEQEFSDKLFFEETHNDIWNHSVGGEIEKYDALIDAFFGTGLTKPVYKSFETTFELINGSEKPLRVSVDLPSGLNADLNHLIGKHIQADLTVTFTAPKSANVLPPASNFNGELVVANIGSPQELIDNSPSQLFLAEKEDAQNWLKKSRFTSDSYKNKRGHALLIVGSREYTGAAVLAANAAMLSGVGLTTVATSESAQTVIAARVLEEIITRRLPENENGTIAEKAFSEIEKLTKKADALGIGCGLGQIGDSKTGSSEDSGSPRVSKGEKSLKKSSNSAEENPPLLTRGLLPQIVENRKTPIVIDADALNALSPFELKGSDKLPLILTPHEGEFLRLLGTEDKEILKDRVKAVRDFAETHKVILVLKGERILIGSPDGTVVINPTGNSGLGKAGNGDTLAGIVTGFVAQAARMKIDVFETVVAAVYIAGLAGDIAAEKFDKRTMLASDVRECLGAAFREIEISGESNN